MLHTLTEARIRATQPNTRTQRLFDGGGLYLEVSPKNGRWWRLKYRFGEKEKRISLGVYPEISLKVAREKMFEARQKIANDIDPSVERQAIKSSRQEATHNCFEVVAREWSASQHAPTVSAGQSDRVLKRLERDIFPWIGSIPIAELDGVTVLRALRRVESRGAIETAHRELHSIGQVFRYAVASGRAARNPCADLRGSKQSFNVAHHLTAEAGITRCSRSDRCVCWTSFRLLPYNLMARIAAVFSGIRKVCSPKP